MIEAESEPDPGSVVARDVIFGSSPVSGRSQASFCSDVPRARIGSAKNPFEHTKFPIPGSPKHSCSWTRHWVKTSVKPPPPRSEEHTSELQSRGHLVCRLLLEKKKHEQTALHST